MKPEEGGCDYASIFSITIEGLYPVRGETEDYELNPAVVFSLLD